MKILSLDIASFGKFKSYQLDLPDNMTVVFGENENGKSTIMSFIRMMFYGNTGKTTDIDKNPRIKYRPWDSELMAGSIVFEHGGHNYRLEREFKKSNSTDKITLIDLDTGIATSLSGSDDIGSRFFGLTDSAFERSVFISESIPTSKNEDANGEINSRLSNVATTGNEEISFEKISARLIKAKEALFSRGGKKGLYDKAVAAKETIASDIALAQETERKLDELRRAIAEKEAALSKSSLESAKLFNLLKSADKIKKKALTEKYLEAVKTKNQLEDKLRLKDGNIADNDFTATGRAHLANYKSTTESFAETDKKCCGLLAEIDRLSSENSTVKDEFAEERIKLTHSQNVIESEIDTARKSIIEINKKIEELTPTKKKEPLFFIAGLIVLLLGGVLFATVGAVIGGSVIGAGILLTVLGFIIKKKVAPDDTEYKNQLNLLTVNLASLIDEKDAISDKLGNLEKQTRDIQVKALADKAILEEKQRELENLLLEKEKLSVLVKETENVLLSHISLLTEISDIKDAASKLDSIDSVIRELESTTQRANMMADHASITSEEQAKSRLEATEKQNLPENLSEEDLDLAKERFKAQSDQNGKIRSEISSLKAQLKAMAEGTPSTALLRLKDEELSAKIDGYNDFGDKVDLTLEVLDEAFRELRRNYSGTLENRITEIFAHITEQKYSSVNVSKNFELGVKATDLFGLKDSQFLSSGTEDQLYLALRLALAELMTEQTGVLPILMDDPLSQYDDKRMVQTIEFLFDYAKSRQLILFTCHNTVADAAKANGANIITL